MSHPKRPEHPKTTGVAPIVGGWLVRARAVVELGTAIVTLVGAVVALLARFGVPWLR